MELGLTLGEAPPPKPFSFLAEKRCSSSRGAAAAKLTGLGLGFCMSLGGRRGMGEEELEEEEEGEDPNGGSAEEGSPAFPLQLDLLPFHPVPRSQLPWPSDQGISDRCFDVNRLPSAEEQEDGVHSQPISSSSPASAAEAERASSRASDEEENGLSRKKLRLSREQSAFLEESFKEHNTLNPKQKLALAKQLNLRPRQVEVWFQNRRARTKLKQTEVDCEHLKRCCERLTEENRRLQKELQELRALKTSHPFYMHLPATTLTMCPSCERVASTTSATAPVAPTAPVASEGLPRSSSSPSTRPVFFPFGPHQGQSSAGS